MDINVSKLQAVINSLETELFNRRNNDGYWEGRLSSSALSTATAVFALAVVDREKYDVLINKGVYWLCGNINDDGGWGDTIRSKSNISTTLLALTAISYINRNEHEKTIGSAQKWLTKRAGSLEPKALIKAIDQKYGDDKTFSCPILTMAALGGVLGSNVKIWDNIKALPFELAAFPQSWFRFLGLPVVSYALPALIAIGQVNYFHKKPGNLLVSLIRKITIHRTRKVLQKIQPQSGGFLEAAPLTSFVVMSLASMGLSDYPVVIKAVRFLESSVRDDGSWPIDTNLAIWVTTLSVNALSIKEKLSEISKTKDWLLSQQYKHKHPYTGAEPGGWAWTNLSGAVPDADDTAGALLALRNISGPDMNIIKAARSGIEWLLEIQNKDGGIPTFCKGWSKLPFDRSSCDLTAHAVAAMSAWQDSFDSKLRRKISKSLRRAVIFLQKAQNPDGSWHPLWFGNESAPKSNNPSYGSAGVLTHISAVTSDNNRTLTHNIQKGLNWLLINQNIDGGWGAVKGVSSSIEETAWVIDALSSLLLSSYEIQGQNDIKSAIKKGLGWLMPRIEEPDKISATAIGLYFARLWYYEELYPLIFSLSAMQKVCLVKSLLQ